MGTTTIDIKEFRDNTDSYVAKVKRGGTFLVLQRSKPAFKVISPLSDDDNNWETVIDFRKIKRGGVPSGELLTRIKQHRKSRGQNR